MTAREAPAAPEAAEAPAARAHSSGALAAARIGAILASTGILFVPYMLLRLTAGSKRRRYDLAVRWTQRWARWLCRCAGLRVTVEGPLPPPGSFVAPNHTSYADILALGSALPIFFVPKAEMAGWPVIGAITRVSDHVFIARIRGRKLRDTAGEIEDRLRNGQRVCVFLEGTTTGAQGPLLPFKPPLLEPALAAGAPIVPAAIRWSARRPEIDVAEDIAYWKDHVFGAHVWRFMGLTGIEARITFGAPLAREGKERKALAEETRGEVERLRAGGAPHASG